MLDFFALYTLALRFFFTPLIFAACFIPIRVFGVRVVGESRKNETEKKKNFLADWLNLFSE